MTTLREAAKAVLDCWDSPKWGWAPSSPTADLMAVLRAALEQSDMGIPITEKQAEPVAFSQFLTDVVTAAGLLHHGKTDKALAARISQFAFHLRTAPPPAQPAKPLTDELYNELLFAVGRKHLNETRHQTALRYIRQAEMPSSEPAKAAHGIKETP